MDRPRTVVMVTCSPLGREMIDVLARHSAGVLEEVLSGALPPATWHSPLWPLRRAFTSEWLGRVFERAVRYEQRVF
jgi:hypothetical protein